MLVDRAENVSRKVIVRQVYKCCKLPNSRHHRCNMLQYITDCISKLIKLIRTATNWQLHLERTTTDDQIPNYYKTLIMHKICSRAMKFYIYVLSTWI